MKFINIRNIAKVLDIEMKRIDDSFLQSVKDGLNQYFTKNTFLKVSGYDFNSDELNFIINQLKDSKNKVFHEWVEQDSALSIYLLSSGKVIGLPSNINELKEHQLFNEYQEFLTPFLYLILKEQIKDLIKKRDFVELRKHLNFCPLLLKSKRIEIQRPIGLFIDHQLEQLLEPDELNFQNYFELVYSAPFVHVLNQLDSSFYSSLIAYVDTAKLIVSQKKLNLIDLNRIKNALQKIKLTAKHQEQVIIFCQSESFKFKNTFLSSTLKWVKSPLSLIGFIIVLFLLVFFNWDKNKSQKQQLVKTSSGIDSLKDNELNQVDSLFGFKTDSVDNGEDGFKDLLLRSLY